MKIEEKLNGSTMKKQKQKQKKLLLLDIILIFLFSFFLNSSVLFYSIFLLH